MVQLVLGKSVVMCNLNLRDLFFLEKIYQLIFKKRGGREFHQEETSYRLREGTGKTFILQVVNT